MPFRRELDIPILLENVSRLRAIAGYTGGPGIRAQNLVAVDAVCEGLAAGVLVGGEMYVGPDCICGGHGCFEALASTRRIRRTITESRDSHKDSLVYNDFLREDDNLDGLFRAYRRDDSFAAKIIADYVRWSAVDDLGVNKSDKETVVRESCHHHRRQFRHWSRGRRGTRSRGGWTLRFAHGVRSSFHPCCTMRTPGSSCAWLKNEICKFEITGAREGARIPSPPAGRTIAR